MAKMKQKPTAKPNSAKPRKQRKFPLPTRCNPDLTPQELKFCQGYLDHGNATRAYKEAGYRWKNEAVANVQGSKLLRRPYVVEYIQASQRRLETHRDITREKMLDQFIEIMKKCKQDVQVLDGQGQPTGEYTFQADPAIKAGLAICKMMGYIDNRLHIHGKLDHEHQHKHKLSAEAQAYLAKLPTELILEMRKHLPSKEPPKLVEAVVENKS